MAKRNITLTADEQLIRRARIKALKEKKSLNSAFQEWLERYASSDGDKSYKEVMKNLAHINAGKHFTRDELNER